MGFACCVGASCGGIVPVTCILNVGGKHQRENGIWHRRKNRIDKVRLTNYLKPFDDT